jgi:hypothetical protein
MHSTTPHPSSLPRSVLAAGRPGNTRRRHVRAASVASQRYQTASKPTTGSVAAAGASSRRLPTRSRPWPVLDDHLEHDRSGRMLTPDPIGGGDWAALRTAGTGPFRAGGSAIGKRRVVAAQRVLQASTNRPNRRWVASAYFRFRVSRARAGGVERGNECRPVLHCSARVQAEQCVPGCSGNGRRLRGPSPVAGNGHPEQPNRSGTAVYRRDSRR